jgi:hypothetical protein
VNGTSCWPLVPITAGDIEYFNSLEQGLNKVEAKVAAANGETFVDTWDSSIGHDACKPPGVAWVNGIIPTSVAFPLHPNEAGEANMARQVLATLDYRPVKSASLFIAIPASHAPAAPRDGS